MLLVNRRQFVRFLDDDHGQDIVEYALLCAFIGVIGIAAWNAIENSLEQAYTNYDTGQQELWSPCDPGVAACPDPLP